ncbi:hypothetical protein [Gordonia terrae]|uniref:hypothetical protein n=1 Tax=Gordonia terrae TaxID=2055 RepID=UPI003F6CD6D0
MEPSETGTPSATPDDARRKVDELEERTVDEPDTPEPNVTEQEDPDSSDAGVPEPPD